MEISIREWRREDLTQIRLAWLDYCGKATRSDMRLRHNAEAEMREWLKVRFKHSPRMGFIAEKDETVAGFVIARVDDWESSPPIIEPRRIGMIDAVYVGESFRRQGIGSQLIERAIQAMREADAIAVETIYDAWNEGSTRVWSRAGFAPWMVHAYRML
jgi:GNAT superfamily N-acetyltransferase